MGLEDGGYFSFCSLGEIKDGSNQDHRRTNTAPQKEEFPKSLVLTASEAGPHNTTEEDFVYISSIYLYIYLLSRSNSTERREQLNELNVLKSSTGQRILSVCLLKNTL